MNPHQAEFQRNGYALLRGCVAGRELDRLHQQALRVAQTIPAPERAARRSSGSFVRVLDQPELAHWATHPDLLAQLALHTGRAVHLSSLALVSKQPHAPPTFWHQDWWGWQEPASYSPFVHQVGLALYLVDSQVTSGCLRVIPGSHRHRHALHANTLDAHAVDLRAFRDPNAPAYQDHPDARTLPVNAGDAVLFDARVLHGACANPQDHERPALVAWWFCNLDAWSSNLRRAAPMVQDVSGWPTAQRTALEKMLPPTVAHAGSGAFFPDPDARLV